MALRLNGATDGSVSIEAPADTSPTGTDVTLTLPTSAGSSGQYLQTNGSGTLSWQTVSVTPDAITEGNTSAEVVDTGTDGHFKVITEGTERMRLNSAGTLGLGFGLDQVPWSGNAIGDYNGFRFTNATSGGSIAVGMNCNNETVCVMHRTDGTGRMLEFKYNNSVIGFVNGGSSSVSYNTSSDYRLKENVVNLDNAISRVKQLLPRRFNWISDESNTLVDGFIAHEAAVVVPEAVTGTYNEVEVWKEGQELPDGVSAGDTKLDENGNTIPVYQGVDQSKFVPLLTAALQEAIAKIETLETANASLEARLTALEGGAS